MKIELDISAEKIADLMCSAVEGNHMTRAWCKGITLLDEKKHTIPTSLPWYASPHLYGEAFVIEVVEILDESKAARGNNLKTHRVDPAAMVKGFVLMATENPGHFGDFMAENGDAVTADVFLQCVALGEVKYG